MSVCLYVYVCVSYMCLMAAEARESVWFPVTGAADDIELLSGKQELYLGPLQEQVHLTSGLYISNPINWLFTRLLKIHEDDQVFLI